MRRGVCLYSTLWTRILLKFANREAEKTEVLTVGMTWIRHHLHGARRHGHVSTGFLCAFPPQLPELGKEVDSTARDGLTPQGHIPTALSPLARRVLLKVKWFMVSFGEQRTFNLASESRVGRASDSYLDIFKWHDGLLYRENTDGIFLFLAQVEE